MPFFANYSPKLKEKAGQNIKQAFWPTKGGTIRKVMGGGGDFRAARIFYVNISFAGAFFSVCRNIFSRILAVHDFVYSTFPSMDFCTSPPPPPPDSFSNCPFLKPSDKGHRFFFLS